MTTKQQEISESKETEKIVIREIKPILPREIWEIIFYLIPIRDKLTCSKLIIEFRDFYQELFTNYEKYVDSFRDFKVEKASLNGLNLYQMHPYGFSHDLSIPSDSASPSISFSIYLENSWVRWLDDTLSSFKYITYEDDGTNNKYLTYLKVNAISWLRFRVQNIILPTGRYNLYYKIKGPCHNIRNLYMVSVKHRVTREDNVGYIDLRTLQDLSSDWEWVPVYRDNTFNRLMEVGYKFEGGDELSVELFSLNEFWTRDLSFHVIRFVAVDDVHEL